MTRDEHDYQRLSRIPAPIATKEAQHRGVAIMRKAGGLTRAPNETASVKQPKLAGFPITQHHFAPWQGRGAPHHRPRRPGRGRPAYQQCHHPGGARAGAAGAAVVLAVAHDEFKSLDISSLTNGKKVVYDVKGMMSEDVVDGKL